MARQLDYLFTLLCLTGSDIFKILKFNTKSLVLVF